MMPFPLTLFGAAAPAAQPSWVNNYAAKFGVTPDVAVDFANARAWQKNIGQGLPDALCSIAAGAVRWHDNLAGNWLSFAPNTLAYTNKGLRVWEARTNAIRNNSMGGAVVGTPGTLPTNWVETHNTNIVPTVVGMGVDSGIDYIDIQVSGTAAVGNNNIFFEGGTVIPVAVGQTWSSSVFVKMIAGSMSNFTNPALLLYSSNSGGAPLENNYTYLIPTSSWQRAINTYTFAIAGAAYVNSALQINPVAAGPVNLTIRIGWPQLEQMPFATPPIRTTNAAVTEAVEAVTLKTPPAFGSAYSMYAAGVPYMPSGITNAMMLQADIGDDTQRSLFYRSAGQVMVFYFAGGTGGAPSNSSPLAVTNALVKVAGAAAPGDQAIILNGAALAGGLAALAVLPNTPTAVRVGTQNAGAMSPWDGDITEFAIWPTTRVPNAGLIAGTT
jgi:hypothetical protein